jgi:hypothetical protein
LFKYLTIWLLTLRQHLRSPPVVVGGVQVAHHSSYLCVVLLFVFTFRVPCCNVCYDFLIITMFGSSLPSVACLRAYVLFTFSCSLVVSNSYCVVFFVVLLQLSLDCPSLIAPSVFSNVYLHWKHSLLILLMYIFFLPLTL